MANHRKIISTLRKKKKKNYKKEKKKTKCMVCLTHNYEQSKYIRIREKKKKIKKAYFSEFTFIK